MTANWPRPAARNTGNTPAHTGSGISGTVLSGGSRGHCHRPGPGADQLTQAELAGRLLGAVDDTRGDAGDGGLEPRGRRLLGLGLG